MGVPCFYSWLVNKYPNIRVKAIEELGDVIDWSSPNPNGIEFDNLYLDMNSIIYPCFGPHDTLSQVFNNICEDVDLLFSIVRPRKLLYLAIDGVAPRAKTFLQRSVKFSAAKLAELIEEEKDRLRDEFEREGKRVLPKGKIELYTSNINPGTKFMHILSSRLKGYIQLRMNNDPDWKDIQVILSDVNVPGEGEHKIMNFIRIQRSLPGYNCNTKHCLYGPDADLIMLALATHEVHISILREDFISQKHQAIFQSAPETISQAAESSLPESRDNEECESSNSTEVKKPFEFLHIWILRKYLELEMNISDQPQTARMDPEQLLDVELELNRRKSDPPKTLKMDLEQIIDDFIFMCFFVGNDFLPKMPTLEVREGCIDLLIYVYKNHFTELGGYLVDMQRVGDINLGFINLERVEKFIIMVGTYEEKIFKKRSDLHVHKVRRLLECAERDSRENVCSQSNSSSSSPPSNGKSPTSLAEAAVSDGNATSSSRMCHSLPDDENEILRNTQDLKEKSEQNVEKRFDLLNDSYLESDKVKLGFPGWRERYYKEKFSAETPDKIETIRKEIVHEYTEGLIWLLLYYFSEVPSWSWFYPYHYGPFASDLKGLAQVKVKFGKGRPFKPFEQLLGILSPISAHLLPKPFARLMKDENSSIIDFYPNDFEIDTDGKRFAWQGICKLPFIDEERLLSETRRLEKELTKDEEERNSEKVDLLFVGRSSNSAFQIPNLVSRDQNEMMKVDATLSGGIGGFIRICDDDFSKVNSSHLEEMNIIVLWFKLPTECLHLPRPLEGVQYPEMNTTELLIEVTPLWHECFRRKPYTRTSSQETYRRANGSSNFAWSSSSSLVQNRRTKMFTSDKSPEIHKFAGSGWGGSGRGRTDPNFGEQTGQHSPRMHVRGPAIGGGPNWDPQNPNAHPSKPSSEGTLNNHADESKVGSGMEQLKVEESSYSFRPNFGQGHLALRNVVSSAAAGSKQRLQFTQKQVLQGNENPSSDSMGRGQWDKEDDCNRRRNKTNSFFGNHCPW
ncbi:hypothetical protein SLEP1_g43309 [Rubroshorea leprosula]|uniref:5'-3' exoribonuclease n=1 Tax=Rubroshorea leprosula TaxID=152421 RepID=A0AAV5LD24_9ROSI|nr:hypothetical protein SLEP1_g43309 [Rubroshorea leprosula]